MSQDLADHLEVRSGIDLPARVAVPKRVGPDHLRYNTCLPCIEPDAMSNGPTGYGLVGHPLTQEHASDALRWWSLPTQVRGQRPCDGRQQRQLDAHLGLRPPCPQNAGLPVQVFQSQGQHFRRAQAIRREELAPACSSRWVAAAWWRSSRCSHRRTSANVLNHLHRGGDVFVALAGLFSRR